MSLPAGIQEIIRAIGPGPAMVLVQTFGGQEIRIPRSAGSEAWAVLVEAIGEASTRQLAAALGGGDPIYIALCMRALKADRNARMIARYDALLGEGNSGRRAVAQLVREFAPISYRQIETIVNSALPDPGAGWAQNALF